MARREANTVTWKGPYCTQPAARLPTQRFPEIGYLKTMRRYLSRWIVLVALLPGPALAGETPREVTFNRDIRALLSDRCFACHGPDEGKREAGLRLDSFEGATADLGGYAAIVAGDPENSELLHRISSEDPELVMPPPVSNKPPLTKTEIATIQRWIKAGAEYQQHWSLIPMARPAPPRLQVDPKVQPQNEIDQFILAALAERGLGSLSPEASKERLLRRVTLDLTGLPPTNQELDAFLADSSPDAYEKVVDRLLASPRTGERLASEWLDVARFADTHGYQMDRFRPMWAYRDWVIKAFNENLPYDDFVRWQIAGDLLPNPTQEQILATAFNRLHSQNEEGGIVEEEFRVAYVVDRVTTFGTAFLGLTFECTRCHDHKYDPLTMRDFYSLFAFFQNIPEAGQTTYFTSSMPTPTLLLTTDKQEEELAALRSDMERCEAEVSSARAAALAELDAWLSQRPAELPLPGLAGSFDFESFADGKLPNAVDAKKGGRAVESPAAVAGPSGQGAELTGDNGFTFPGIGHFHRSQPFSFSIRLMQPQRSPRATVFHHSKAPADAGHRGYDLLLEDGHVAFGLYHMWPGNAVKVRTKATIEAGQWTQVTVTHDGSGQAAGLKTYLDGVEADTEIICDRLQKDIHYENGNPELAIGYRFRDNGFKDGVVDDFLIFERELSDLEVAQLASRSEAKSALTTPAAELSESQRRILFDYYFLAVSERGKAALEKLQTARAAYWKLVHEIPEAMVMRELAEPKPAFILARGNYDQPTTPVTADTPAVLPDFPSDSPRNRLGLAQWLLDPEHPLFARVTVNRYWQMLFGRGIVETTDNFGSQGAMPTHPELLDWLARDFIAHDWDLRWLLKQIVMSATYRQDSRARDDAMQKDPDNLLLARAPVRRLSAEMLRDQALYVSQLLVEKLGGPSVKPYQPAGLWNIAMGNPTYDQSHGPDLYRRSLYTFWKRTVPPPAMVTFDAADRSYCTVRRQATSTPLQALVLLNDPQHVEAAREAASRMLREGGKTQPEQVTWLFRAITSRFPTEREQSVLVKLFEEELEIFSQDPGAATAAIAIGESKAEAALSPVELAAATVLAQAIFNHDDAVHQR